MNCRRKNVPEEEELPVRTRITLGKFLTADYADSTDRKFEKVPYAGVYFPHPCNPSHPRFI